MRHRKRTEAATMDAAEIMKLGEGDAQKLFPGSPADVKRLYRQLAREWHPDLCADPMAKDVFSHIARLHDALVNGNTTARPTGSSVTRRWKMKAGKAIEVRPVAVHKSAFGDVLVTRSTLACEFVSGFEDIADKEATIVGSFAFASSKMRDSMSHFLPKLVRRIDAVGVSVNVFSRPSDTILLVDLLRHLGGRMAAVHVAWIVSSLENMACYLEWMGVCHGGISLETVLVSPSMHSIILVGGLGGVTKFDERPIALPQRTLSLVPRLAAPGQTVDPTVDLVLVRSLAMQLLGASSAGSLAALTDVPAAMKTWLSLPPASTAREDYASWEKCLLESFGPRKFVKLEIDPAVVYDAA